MMHTFSTQHLHICYYWRILLNIVGKYTKAINTWHVYTLATLQCIILKQNYYILLWFHLYWKIHGMFKYLFYAWFVDEILLQKFKTVKVTVFNVRVVMVIEMVAHIRNWIGVENSLQVWQKVTIQINNHL